MKTKILLLLLLIPALASAQTRYAKRPFDFITVAPSSTPVFDASQTDTFKMVLTLNVSSSTLIGAESGMPLNFLICQDATGGRTFSWPAQVNGPIAISSSAGTCTLETFRYDGTTAYNPTTATGGGGGAGTVNTGTGGNLPIYATTGTTLSHDVNLNDNVSNANGLTYLGSAGIFASQVGVTGPGAMVFGATNSTCSGAAPTKTLICLGDLTSLTGQISNNGDSFRSIMTHTSSSPVQHGVFVAGPFPLSVALARGTPGQPLCEGASAADPGWCQLDLSLPTNVTGRPVKANQTASTVYNDQTNTFTAAGGLDLTASTVASAFRVPIAASITTALNGAIGYDSVSNNVHFGVNGADSRVFIWTGTAPVHHNCLWAVNVSGHVEAGDAGTTCGGGSTPRLDQVLSATNAWTTTNADNPFNMQFATTTAGRIALRLSESAAGTSTGTPFLHQIDTLAGSTNNPLNVCAQGTTNCWRFDTANLLKPIGTATLAIPGTDKGIVVSHGPTAANTTVTGVLNQLVSFDASGNPIAADPIISYNYVTIWTAQDVTVTRTSAAARNPIFSQTGTVQLTWASITGSPATCTLQFQGVDSAGNALNNGSTFSVTPANGTTSQTFTAAAGLQSAAQIKAIFACVTYPTTGTLTLEFTPIPNVNVTNTVTTALAAGSNLIGKVGIDQTTPGTTNAVQVTNLPATLDTGNGATSANSVRVTLSNDSTGQVVPAPTTASADAVTPCNILTTASTNSTSCKGSAGNFYGFEVFNNTTTIYYLRLYNSSTAPTCSSATGFIRTIPIPPAGAAGQAGGAISNQPFPVNFGTGIGYCITGGSTSTDNTNAAAGVFGEIRYK